MRHKGGSPLTRARGPSGGDHARPQRRAAPRAVDTLLPGTTDSLSRSTAGRLKTRESKTR